MNIYDTFVVIFDTNAFIIAQRTQWICVGARSRSRAEKESTTRWRSMYVAGLP